MSRSHRHRSHRGHSSRAEPPQTYEEAYEGFQERHLAPPPLLASAQERAVVDRELRMLQQVRWTGSVRDWTALGIFLCEIIEEIRNPSSDPSSSEENSDFDDNREYLPPAGGASHQPAASGRTDRAGGYPSYMPSYSTSDPGSPEREPTPPPPYSRNSERGNAGGLREAYETIRRQGTVNIGGSREGYGNSRSHGGGDARSTGAMDRERFPEQPGGEWVIESINLPQDQRHRRSNRLHSGRRGGR